MTTLAPRPGVSKDCLSLCPPGTPGMAAWGGLARSASPCAANGEGARLLQVSHAGERPAFFPHSQRPHPSCSPPGPPPRLPQPRSHPVLTCAGLFLGSCLDVCGCPTGLPPPPSQPSSPVGHQTVILRSPIWLFPQSGSKAQFPSQGAPCKDNRPYGVCAAAGGGGEYSQQDHGLPGQGGV